MMENNYEIRMSKCETNPKFKYDNFKNNNEMNGLFCFEFLVFEFVSDFGFCVSDFKIRPPFLHKQDQPLGIRHSICK